MRFFALSTLLALGARSTTVEVPDSSSDVAPIVQGQHSETQVDEGSSNQVAEATTTIVPGSSDSDEFEEVPTIGEPNSENPVVILTYTELVIPGSDLQEIIVDLAQELNNSPGGPFVDVEELEDALEQLEEAFEQASQDDTAISWDSDIEDTEQDDGAAGDDSTGDEGDDSENQGADEAQAPEGTNEETDVADVNQDSSNASADADSPVQGSSEPTIAV